MLAKRFSNIAANKKTGRLKSAAASVLAVVIAATTLLTSGVLADTIGSYGAGDIAVFVNGRNVSLSNKPFVDNHEVYVPLRETLNACGVADNNITYLDGQINMTLHSDVTDSDYTAHINIGAQNIKFDGDTAGDWHLVDGTRTTTHPAILKDGVTYMPVGMFSRIKQYDIEIKDKAQHHKGFRYNRALPVKLLKGLTVRKYDENGFDVVLEDWTTAESYKPEDYYENGEKVIIGTLKKQEEQGYPVYVQTNWYNYPTNAVKRIVTDEEGRVLCVVMVENQKHEALNGSGLSAAEWNSGWENMQLPEGSLISEGMNYVCDRGVFRPHNSGSERLELCYQVPVDLITPPVE